MLVEAHGASRRSDEHTTRGAETARPKRSWKSFTDNFESMEFDKCTDEQACDLISVCQSLDAVQNDTEEEGKQPTFYKVLYHIEKKIREGNQEVAMRWPRAALDVYWNQLIGRRAVAWASSSPHAHPALPCQY